MIQTYLVGGAVRDKLLGLPVKDRDWVVIGASAQAMLDQGFRSVGKDFPVFLHPHTHEEYALARTERKTGKGYHGFDFDAAPSVTLQEDLQRRDLTINALAEDAQGQVLDYVGGQQDLADRLLRHVSPAFAEDPVRILRIARLAARYAGLGFTIAAETQQLMTQMVQAGEVDALVAERVWQETNRALAEPHPEVYIEVLRECGALAVLFPDIDRLFGVPQPEQYHPEIDTGVHTLMVLQQAVKLSDDSAVRFAALTHDLGKGTTAQEILPHHYQHEMRGMDLIDALCDRYKVSAEYRDLAIMTARYHTHIHKAFELKAKTQLKMLDKCDAFRRPQRFEKMLLACKADSRGRTGYESRDYPQLEYNRQALRVCMAVNVQEIVEAGCQGEAIREALRLKRLTVLRRLRADYNVQRVA